MGKEISLSNGLVWCVWRLGPNAATIALENMANGRSELRSVRPEASVTIDGAAYAVGELVGQPIHNYLLPEWVDAMTADPGAFTFAGHRIGKTKERFAWKPRPEWISSKVQWPPAGVSLELDFNARNWARGRARHGALRDVRRAPRVEQVDHGPERGGEAGGARRVCGGRSWGAVEPAAMVGGKAADFTVFPQSSRGDRLFIRRFDGSGVDAPAVKWKIDPLYETQVNYDRQTPCLLECALQVGPGVSIEPGAVPSRSGGSRFCTTQRTGDAGPLRRMYRAMAPWTQENPLIFHVRSAEPASVRGAIDQAAAVGFELVIMTFGSGFDAESNDPTYVAGLKELADYAHAKGVALGDIPCLRAARSMRPTTW